ncbi:MAG: extracellular solute-binding protein [Lachnospira sp.]|nr:extracellular solute-binding protein [Lachnospira sp.]
MSRYFRIMQKCLALVLVFVIGISAVACSSKSEKENVPDDMVLETSEEVTIWYSNVIYKDYLAAVSEALHAANSKLTVNVVFISKDDYLTKIYDASMREEKGPDVYIADSSELEKIWSMGLVAENNSYSSNYTADNYCDNAIQAATFNGKLYGYPLCYNVAFMAYNPSYAYEISTFTQLKEYISKFESSEDNADIKQIVAWDVTDMFLNFPFSAGSVQIGGVTGDDSTIAETDEVKLAAAMKEFLTFRDEYGIVSEMSTRAFCNELFRNGSMSYTIMDMRDLKSVVDSGVSFNVQSIPAMTDSLKANTNTLSETTLALVSPYAKNVELAKNVANALSFEYAPQLFEKTGYLSAKNVAFEGDYADEYKKLHEIYANSNIKAQFRGASSMYAYYEILINQVWSGEDISESVSKFASQLKPREIQTESQSVAQ